MIIVDTALQRREHEGRPIRVGLVGAGFMAHGVALQITTAVPGMRVAAIASRKLDDTKRAYRESGIDGVRVVETLAQLERAVKSGTPAVTDDALLLCRAAGIDAIVEVPGTIEHAARATLKTCRELTDSPCAGFSPYRSCRGLQAQASDFQRQAADIRQCRAATEPAVRSVLA